MPFKRTNSSSSKRFNVKKVLPRKVQHPLMTSLNSNNSGDREKEVLEDLEMHDITVTLGTVTSTLADGTWHNDINHKPAKEIVELRKSNDKLKKEGNMLRVKTEILIDLVTTKTVQMEKMEKELKQLREILSKGPFRFSELD